MLQLIKQNRDIAEGVNLFGRNLDGIDLSNLDLSGIFLERATLQKAFPFESNSCPLDTYSRHCLGLVYANN